MIRYRKNRCWMAASAMLMFFAVPMLQAQFNPAPDESSALSIPQDHLLRTQQLNDMLQDPKHAPMTVLQVGSRLLFAQAHIAGSEYVGPGGQPAGQDLLRKRVASLPKDRLIVLYCGCCPWERCPNVSRAFALLRDSGFKNVKVLYIANNFGEDWVAKGYRVEKGE